jgi:hypothetical protein
MASAFQLLTECWDLVAVFAEQLLARGTLDRDEIVKVAVDAGWGLPPRWKSDNDEELDTALQAFLPEGERVAFREVFGHEAVGAGEISDRSGGPNCVSARGIDYLSHPVDALGET